MRQSSSMNDAIRHRRRPSVGRRLEVALIKEPAMKKDPIGSWFARVCATATCVQFAMLGSAQAAEPAVTVAVPAAAPPMIPTAAPVMLPPPAPPPGPVPTAAPVMAPPPPPAPGPVPVDAPTMIPAPPPPRGACRTTSRTGRTHYWVHLWSPRGAAAPGP
jgi:hypothetical protein